MERQNWVNHKFHFNIDVGWGQNVLTRISDVGVRCQYHCKGLSNELLSSRESGKWSIKEHIGHLIDLEELHINRLNEFQKMEKQLSPADMSNLKTNLSNHNDTSIEQLIVLLNTERQKLIEHYHSLSDENLNHSSLHPRLKVEIKPVDLLFFIGEHDDHHITSILEIKRKIK